MRRAAWGLVLLGLLPLAAARGSAPAPSADVRDTHERIARIQQRLGIEEEKDSARGCGGEPGEAPAQASAPQLPAWLGYLLISVLLAVLLGPLALMLREALRSNRTRSAVKEEPEPEAPASVGRQPWHVDLSLCHQLIAQGRIAEACAALHRLTLLSLEQSGQLRLETSTTNWGYVRQLGASPALQDALAEVTRAAEQSVLGQRPPELADYAMLEQLVVTRLQEASSS